MAQPMTPLQNVGFRWRERPHLRQRLQLQALQFPLQVARLTGHPLATVAAVRALLERTGSPVSDVPQADEKLQIGPQVDVHRAVEALLTQAGISDQPTAPRVAIVQSQEI